MARVVDGTGFFAAAFVEQPDPMLPGPPAGELGPKLIVTWHVPNGTPVADAVRQDLYPYAAGGPVTYTEGGQPFLQSEHTHGGWFRAPASFLSTLTGLGVPSSPPLPPPPPPPPLPSAAAGQQASPIVPVLLVVGVAVGAAMVTSVGVAARRRRRVAPA